MCNKTKHGNDARPFVSILRALRSVLESQKAIFIARATVKGCSSECSSRSSSAVRAWLTYDYMMKSMYINTWIPSTVKTVKTVKRPDREV